MQEVTIMLLGGLSYWTYSTMAMNILDQLMDNPELMVIINVVIAAVLTLFVGAEREKANKAAGMRTNMIVGSFTCLVVSLIDPLLDFVNTQNAQQLVESDPIRVLQSIVIGVSFIGAGTIIKQEDKTKVTGITTAATLLYSVGIGMSVALQYYVLATFLTVFILVINRVINYVEKKFIARKD